MNYNTDDEIYRHHSSDIDLIEQLLDEPDTEYDWTPISRRIEDLFKDHLGRTGFGAGSIPAAPTTLKSL